MKESEQLIGIYHTAFTVCLVLVILFAGISIFLFFSFRIKEVFNFLTGRAQKRSVQQMEEENAKTGKLRQDYYSSSTSSDLYAIKSSNILPTAYKEDADGKARTAPLEIGNSEEIYQDSESEETMLLDSDLGETTLLTSQMDQGTVEAMEPVWNFIIKKELMEIHTEEII